MGNLQEVEKLDFLHNVSKVGVTGVEITEDTSLESEYFISNADCGATTTDPTDYDTDDNGLPDGWVGRSIRG